MPEDAGRNTREVQRVTELADQEARATVVRDLVDECAAEVLSRGADAAADVDLAQGRHPPKTDDVGTTADPGVQVPAVIIIIDKLMKNRGD